MYKYTITPFSLKNGTLKIKIIIYLKKKYILYIMDEPINYEFLYNNLLIEYNKLKKNNDNIIIENKQLIEHLQKYTAPERSKKYYKNNKEIINQKTKDYHKNLSPEKIKEYSKSAYEKKKLKLLEEKNV